MNDELSVPPSALLFILLQRTAYQSAILSRLLRRVPAPASLLFARLESSLRREAIAARFVRGVQRDYKSIAGALPKDASAILDLGCGVAAIDVLLSRHYSDRGPVKLYLVDFEETSAQIDYGFSVTPSRYNSLRVAKEFLLANKVPVSTIHFVSPEQILRASDVPPLQLVISTLAWGFHFPVETYAPVVSAAMAPEGRLILDIRVGTDGIERLRDYFPVVEVIEETEVRCRVVART